MQRERNLLQDARTLKDSLRMEFQWKLIILL